MISYRWGLILRAMLPMALVTALAYYALPGAMERLMAPLVLLTVCGTYFVGRWATRRFDLRLHELLGALVVDSILSTALPCFVPAPYQMLFTLYIGTIGLFLLPLFDPVLRRDPEMAVPTSQILRLSVGIGALLCLIGTTCSSGGREAFWAGAALAAVLYGVAIVFVLALLSLGKPRDGARIGSCAAVVMVIFLALVSLISPPP